MTLGIENEMEYTLCNRLLRPNFSKAGGGGGGGG